MVYLHSYFMVLQSFICYRRVLHLSHRYFSHKAHRKSVWGPLWSDTIDNSPLQSNLTFSDCAKENLLPESKQDNILTDKQLVMNTASPTFPLQIIGDPGIGKSKILGYRAAWLIYKYNIPPENIFIFTRTRLDSQEPVTNVTNLLEPNQYKGNTYLTAGTIHYHCLRYLNLHGDKLNLAPNFTILCPEQQQDLISLVLVPHDIVDIHLMSSTKIILLEDKKPRLGIQTTILIFHW